MQNIFSLVSKVLQIKSKPKFLLILCILTCTTSCTVNRTISTANQNAVASNYKSIIVFKPRFNPISNPLYGQYDDVVLFWRNIALRNNMPENNFLNVIDGGSDIILDPSFLSYRNNEYVKNLDSSVAMVISPGTYTLNLIHAKYKHQPKIINTGIETGIRPRLVTKTQVTPGYDYYQYSSRSGYNPVTGYYKKEVYQAKPTINVQKSVSVEPEFVAKPYSIYDHQTDFIYLTIPDSITFTIKSGEVIYLGNINLYYNLNGDFSYSINNDFDSVYGNGIENFPTLIDRFKPYYAPNYIYGTLIKIDSNRIHTRNFTKTKIDKRYY